MSDSLGSSSNSFNQSDSDLIKTDSSQFDNDSRKKVHKRFILIIVSIALLLDGMLNMVILPIVPEFLKYLNNGTNSPADFINKILHLNQTGSDTAEETASKFDPNDASAKFTYNTNDILMGCLFATKPLVQLLINPFSGAIIDHIGYDLPMLFGLAIQFSSTLIFTYTNSFGYLIMARGLQGVGSAIADTSGFSMIADCYRDQAERTKAIGIAITALALGSFMSVPFSGVLFEYVGKQVPFIALACLALFDAFLLIFNWKSKCRNLTSPVMYETQKKTPIWTLLTDPYILVCAMSLVMANLPLAFVEPTIAVWMKSTLNATESQIGLIWLSGFFPHITAVYVCVWLVKRYAQHQYAFLMIGLTFEALSCLWIPFIKNYFVLMIPISFICFGYGMIDATILPTVAYLVDTRHASVYGSVYAIVDISYAVTYAFGPLVSGIILHFIGFKGLSIILCTILITFVPFTLFLKRIYYFKFLKAKDDQNNLANN